MTNVLKKKPRMTCEQYCPVWNDIDKDCEIYGEHHFTPRTCPHYNIEILEKMKKAEMYNKIIEENYDTQNMKNEQQKDLCITSEQLTEQWKKGELPEGFYYAKCPWCDEVDIRYIHNGVDDYEDIIMPVPTYEEWKALNEQNAQPKEQINKCYLDAINRGTANAVKAVKEFGMPERIKELVEQNTQLKELLKECELWFTGMVGNMNDKNVGEHNRSVPIGNFEYIFKVFSQKINEVLK